MQSLAAFADDSRLYSTSVTGCSNAQVDQLSARENIVSHDMRDVIYSLRPLLLPSSVVRTMLSRFLSCFCLRVLQQVWLYLRTFLISFAI